MAGARHRLVRAGLNQKATSIILNQESEPRKVARLLNDDEGAMEKWSEKFKTQVNTRDVIDFKSHLEKQTQTSVLALMKDDDRTKQLAAIMHEKVARLADTVGEQERIADMLMGDIQTIRDEWGGVDENTGCLQPYPKDIIAILKVLTKTNKEIRETVKFVKEDGSLQTYISNASFTNKQGASESEVLDLVEKMRGILGVTEYDMLRAYSEARRMVTTVDVEGGPIEK